MQAFETKLTKNVEFTVELSTTEYQDLGQEERTSMPDHNRLHDPNFPPDMQYRNEASLSHLQNRCVMQ